MQDFDEKMMAAALREARRAAQRGEVPVGAVAVRGGRIIARGHNLSITERDPSAHAEIVALRRAARRLKNYRLPGIMIYVTVEPCAMCAGAMVWARVKRAIYGCADPKAGALGSLLDFSAVRGFNHRFDVSHGVLEADCRRLLQDFFRKKRAKRKSRAV